MLCVSTSGSPSPSGSPAPRPATSVSPKEWPQPASGVPSGQKAHRRSASWTTSAGTPAPQTSPLPATPAVAPWTGAARRRRESRGSRASKAGPRDAGDARRAQRRGGSRRTPRWRPVHHPPLEARTRSATKSPAPGAVTASRPATGPHRLKPESRARSRYRPVQVEDVDRAVRAADEHRQHPGTVPAMTGGVVTIEGRAAGQPGSAWPEMVEQPHAPTRAARCPSPTA